MARLTAYEGTLDMIVREALEKEYQRGFEAGKKFKGVRRSTSVNDLGLSNKIIKAFKQPSYLGRVQDDALPILTLGDLVRSYESDLLTRSNFGRVALHEVEEMLSSIGLNLGMTDDEVTKKLGKS